MTATETTSDTSLNAKSSNGEAYPLVVDHVTKTYGNNTVVDDLSFTVHPGRVTGFLGPNGSGKSTTMKILLGLASASQGSATIGGRRYRELPNPARTVGAVMAPIRSACANGSASLPRCLATHRSSFSTNPGTASTHVVIINRGRLITSGPLAQLQQAATLVRCPNPEVLRDVLVDAGATTREHDQDGLIVRGLAIEDIGEKAWATGIALDELSPNSGSLEERFLELDQQHRPA